jgi:erythromycin esterase-like protein
MIHSAMSWRRNLPALAVTAVTALAAVTAVVPLAMLVAGNADAAASAAPRQAAAASGWSLQNVPPPSGAGGTLSAISCGGAQACMAVGYYSNQTGAQATLAEAWNGHVWSIVSTPNPASSADTALSAVSCPSAGFCVAAGTWTSSGGQAYPLAERWEGGRWSILAMPNPVTSTQTVLTAVACASAAACIAVGYFDNPYFTQTLAEAWNGHRWSAQQTKNVPNPTSGDWGELNGIWCVSAKACTAVGYYDGTVTQLTLAERWNGKAWSVEPTPNLPGDPGNELNAVSCRSARQCIAVGDYTANSGAIGPLSEAWNGRTWSVEPAPAPKGAQYSYLASVACPSASDCLAVGSTAATGPTSGTLAEQWNGRAWRVESAPAPAGSVQSALSGIWCRSARACVAVGSDTAAVVTRTLAQTWTGSAWKVTPTPGQAEVQASDLNGVSCTTPDFCVAVGYYTDASGTGPLTELWNGKAWSIVTAASPAGVTSASLNAVSCVAADDCVAVGSSFNGTDTVTLAEAWNGTHWSVAATPNVSGAQTGILSAVSCPASSKCVAVGSYATATVTGTLAQTWNGKAWSISKTPNPAGSTTTTLSGVSCPAVNRCMAIGDYIAESGQPALAESWNGSAWAIEAVPSPASASGTFLQDLACRSAADCTAVGSYFNGTGNATLAEGWNGTAWSVQPTPASPDSTYTTLNGVSCPSAGDCVAVGYSTGATVTTTLAIAWNGHEWAIQPTPNPSGAQQSYLYGVSCPQAGSCAAVGDYAASPSAIPLPFAARYQS